MKTLFKVLLALVFISVAWQFTPFADIHIELDSSDYLSEWLVTNLLVVGIVFFAVALVLVIFISVFASVAFFAGLICLAMLVVGMSFFWPVAVFALIVYWALSSSREEAY